MQKKSIKIRPSFYAYCFYPLKEIALAYGYNLVLHGSMNRDMDLIAIPWGEIIGNKEAMIKEMAAYVGGSVDYQSPEQHEEFMRKHFGRDNYTISMFRGVDWWNANKREMGDEQWHDPQFYLDISVTPVIEYK